LNNELYFPGGSIIIQQNVLDEQNRSANIILNQLDPFGCDSILNVNLSINPEYHVLDTIEISMEST